MTRGGWFRDLNGWLLLLGSFALPRPGSGDSAERLLSHVFVWDVEGRAPPVPIAEGYLASWSN